MSDEYEHAKHEFYTLVAELKASNEQLRRDRDDFERMWKHEREYARALSER